MSRPRTRNPVFVSVTMALVLAASLGMWSSSATAADVGGPAKFMPLQPERILDARSGTGASRQAAAAGGTVDLQVMGVGGCRRPRCARE